MADCFKFRSKVGLDVAIEALRNARRLRKITMDELAEAAYIIFIINISQLNIFNKEYRGMDAQEKFEYWLDAAQYDLDTADVMFASGRWMYVLFMCQQAIEKLVKGLYLLYVDDNVPRIHNIRKLLERFEDKLSVKVPEDKHNLFDMLSAFYKNDRYPEYSMGLVGAQINKDDAVTALTDTKGAWAWLLTLKP